MIFDYPDGATPLDPDEARGLLLSHITNRSELDRWEQENIAEVETWAFRRTPRDILTDGFIKRLHKRMFGTVWRWAGDFRTTGKNIGVQSWRTLPIISHGGTKKPGNKRKHQCLSVLTSSVPVWMPTIY